jgi:acetyltransferase
MLTIKRCSAEEAQNIIADLIALLQDGVNGGASIGFLPPLSSDEANAYWRDVINDMAHQKRVLLTASQEGVLVGSVQLDLPMKPNATHRAEVQKLIVHHSARRQGIGSKLMNALEVEAKQVGRSLLVLDTRAGDSAEPLYRQHGYTEAGRIPNYARNGEGGLDATVIFYKTLE